MTGQLDLPAGDFSSWLHNFRGALLNEGGINVDCGDCAACCSSSQFIHVRPEETGTLDLINKDLLVAAPGLPEGHVLLGYDKDGRCPLLKAGKCSIYERRPLTCRIYDCRVFTAAGLTAGGKDKARIDQRVRRWKFSYSAGRDRDEHLAVRAAARFIREHAESFPGGRIPGSPSELAILAVKVHAVFLEEGERPANEMAGAIVEALREFDERMGAKQTSCYKGETCYSCFDCDIILAIGGNGDF